MKRILVAEYLKFVNTEKKGELDYKDINLCYKGGYFNVFVWNQNLEDFLIKHWIKHFVLED